MYRRLLPEPLRRKIRDRLTPASSYGFDFFQQVDELAGASYEEMARSIVETYRPRSVWDAGCGTGALLAALRDEGVPQLRGAEFHDAGLRICRRRKLDVEKVDLTRRVTIPPGTDLVICMEVAEHLPESASDTLVESLTSGPDQLLFSAAVPGQGGHHHINEQAHDYWLEKFGARGFLVDTAATDAIRARWRAAGVAPWYSNNAFVLRRGQV
jgi:SAM-dependent methyltransferase